MTVINKIVLGLSTASALLVVINIGLAVNNQALTNDVSARNAYLQQTGTLNTLYKEIVAGLADLASKTQDVRLKELLDKNGLSLAPAPGRNQAQSGK